MRLGDEDVFSPMNHYRYRSTCAPVKYSDVPDPQEPPGGGWELVGQCSFTRYEFVHIVWSWRQLSFTTPDAEQPK